MSDKERFIDNQDGTMTDSATGMLWMKEDAWQKEAKWYTWDEAKELAIRRISGLAASPRR